MKEFTICIYVKNFKEKLDKLFSNFGTRMTDECSFLLNDCDAPALESACAQMGLVHGKLKDWCYSEEL